jgi:hypothetical protein
MGALFVTLRAVLTPPPHPAGLMEPAPCDHCARAERCGREQLACSSFLRFAAGESFVRWSAAPRTDASRDLYVRALG